MFPGSAIIKLIQLSMGQIPHRILCLNNRSWVFRKTDEMQWSLFPPLLEKKKCNSMFSLMSLFLLKKDDDERNITIYSKEEA